MKKIIIIEGIDGCGKDFVRDNIKGVLGDDIKCFREPDGYFRQILKENGGKLDFMDEFIAMWIGRFVLWINEILNSDSQYIVINRSFPSTFAYQIEGRGLSQYEKSFRFWKKNLLNMFDYSTLEIHHIYLRTDVDVSLSRIGKRNDSDGLDHFEEESLLRRTKGGYDLFYGNKQNFASNEFIHVIDANKSKEEVFTAVKEKLGL